MTNNKDADILANTYNKNVKSVILTENIDPNSMQNAIMHLIAGLGAAALYKIFQFIKKIKEDPGPIDTTEPGTKIDSSGSPTNPNEINAPLSPSLQKDRNTLNKGKTYM